MPELSRRRLLAGAGAAVGVGTLGGVVAEPAGAVTPKHFTLYGSQLRRLGPRGRQLPGTSTTVRGTLHRSEGAEKIGEFFSSGTVLAEQRMLDPELGSFETHLFAMDDGTITGSGTVHHDGTGAFTVTGGSGRHAGARGTYTTRQTADHSGTGQALFTFDLG